MSETILRMMALSDVPVCKRIVDSVSMDSLEWERLHG